MTSGYLRGSNNLLAGASAQGGFTIEESLRFNASQSSYLSRTFGTPTNNKIWTYSVWMKRGSLSANRTIMSSNVDGAEYWDLRFNASDQILIQNRVGSSNLLFANTTAVYRDPSAWYHIVFVFDSDNATAANRNLLYVNGVNVPWSANSGSGNASAWNTSGVQHNIGVSRTLTTGGGIWAEFDGYETEVNFIDGQALDPSSFGQFDSVTGVWKPAKYTGTYGTNGFYLPMQLDNTVEGFNTVTWAGNSSTQQIRGVGFSPDLVWIKVRNEVNSHYLFDTIRGADKALFTDSTSNEIDYTATGRMTSFDNDGFTVKYSSSTGTNASGDSYVGWCWDAGSSTVSNTDGSITSSVRANPTYGFSVVTYTGNGSTGTVGHGLGVAPQMMIIKVRNLAGNSWIVYHEYMGTSPESLRMFLDATDAAGTSTANFNNTLPTSSVFSVGATSATNGAYNYVAYCFSEVAGFSKFGSYTGNGSTSGPTITTGFKPAFVMVKNASSTGSWIMVDATRNVANPRNKLFNVNTSGAEFTTGDISFDFLDDGFQITQVNGAVNASGNTYIYMAFADTREYAYWLDDSGNNNDWQPNGGITTESTVTDTPTPYEDGGNYATWNPLDKGTVTVTNGNLAAVPASDTHAIRGTIGLPTSDKFYWEITVNGLGYGTALGIASQTSVVTTGPSSAETRTYQFGSWFNTFNSGVVQYGTNQAVTGGASWSGASQLAAGDVLMIAVDMTNGSMWVGKNGTWFNTSGTANPATNTDPRWTGLTGTTWFPYMAGYGTASPVTSNINFGQRPFAYTPPTGFLPLHTNNLPDSAIVDGSQYFNAVVYTGNSPSSQTIAVGFQPDFVWQKSRAQTYNHTLYDSVRGATKELYSNTTGAEVTDSNGLTAFTSNGFTVGSDGELNDPTGTHVAWNWKANGAGVSNTDGSITSTVSANPTAGFSIVTYTGTGSAATVGHGLGVAPSMIIVKNRTTAYDSWPVYSSVLGATYRLFLDTTGAQVYDPTGQWNGTAPTSTVFSVGSNSSGNNSGSNLVAYCFAPVEGYSAFGSYTGNGSADGPFVYLGFRPKLLIVKAVDNGGGWLINDSERSPYNITGLTLYADSTASEESYTIGASEWDFLSNGFKNRDAGSAQNTSGNRYIYMAFAENPFKNSLAR